MGADKPALSLFPSFSFKFIKIPCIFWKFLPFQKANVLSISNCKNSFFA